MKYLYLHQLLVKMKRRTIDLKMKKYALVLVGFWALLCLVHAQDNRLDVLPPDHGFKKQKGVAPIGSSQQSVVSGQQLAVNNTYAVVVGISDYQDPGIPDLKYADKDAEAFANFLRSDAGGRLDGDHLKVLINEKASMAQFAIQLDWLLENAKENDRVLIYFSGHGDVEKKTLTQPGFLLCWDAPAQVYMSGGAFALPMLQEVISTLSVQNKAKVIMIMDACRAGKLSGNSINGNQLTNSNLAKQYANEIKILSCQPNEYSLEGTQWGGGRGAFSYHLINALYGLADNNSDHIISLKELSRYLEDEVSKEVSPQSQNPMVIGSVTDKISDVNPGMLAALKSGMKDQTQFFSSVESRGIEDEILANTDTSLVVLYNLFKRALRDKQFLFAEKGHDKNDFADYYYNKLIAEPQLERLHSTLRRNYAAALQDDAQQVMNAWMKTSQDELLATNTKGVNRRLPTKIFNEKLRSFPACLNRAAELLGSGHYMYNALKARSHFFEGYLLANSNRNPNRELGEKALKEFRLALQWQANLPQAYWQMSMVYGYNLLIPDSAEAYAKIAMELQPTWVFPYVELTTLYLDKYKLFEKARYYMEKAVHIDSNSKFGWNGMAIYHYLKKDYRVAEKYYLKAIALDSTNAVFHSNLGVLYTAMQQHGDAELFLYKGLALDSTYAALYNNLGALYNDTRRYADAEKYFLKAIQLDSTDYMLYNNLGITYMKTNRNLEAEKYFLKAIALDSTYPTAFHNLGTHFINTGRNLEAEKYLLKAIALDSTDALIYLNLATLYLSSNRFADAEKYLLMGIQLDSTYSTAYNNLAAVYSHAKRYAEAEKYLHKAIALDPTFAYSYYNLASVWSLQNKTEEAFQQLELAIQKGFLDDVYIHEDADLQNMRAEKERWDALMKKYFPQQHKD